VVKSEAASYLSAVSIMLGAYAFFYGIFRDRIDAGLQVGEAAKAEGVREEQAVTVKQALSTTLPLGFVALTVWLIFLGPVVEALDAGVELGLPPDDYSAIDVAFVVAANVWFAIALILFVQAFRLDRKRRNVRR
jgi:hypothetical protein